MGTQLSAKTEEFKNLLNTGATFKQVKAAFGGREDDAKTFCSEMLDLYGEGGDYLQKCDPQAIIAQCLKAAQLNLPIIKSLGYAYIVPYKGTPTFIIGWKGLIQLAMRSGQYKYINADAIYEGELVKFNRLSGSVEITGEPTSDKAIGYFAYFQLLNGFEHTVYMTKEQVEAYGKKYSKTYNNGPWQTEFDAMAKKTVLRKALSFGPKSTVMQSVEVHEVQAAQTAAQADIIQNANTGDIIDMPETTVKEAPVQQAPAENPAPQPNF